MFLPTNRATVVTEERFRTPARFIVGDTRAVTATLPDGSVDFIMCSPPFLALRSYLPADHPDKANEIGSEATPAEFIQIMLELSAEWRRVLAPHGSIVVELGDTYSRSGERAATTMPSGTNA
jgi:site-specific DNA-methyltransferase (cytosine-N4-specific)